MVGALLSLLGVELFGWRGILLLLGTGVVASLFIWVRIRDERTNQVANVALHVAHLQAIALAVINQILAQRGITSFRVRRVEVLVNESNGYPTVTFDLLLDSLCTPQAYAFRCGLARIYPERHWRNPWRVTGLTGYIPDQPGKEWVLLAMHTGAYQTASGAFPYHREVLASTTPEASS